MDIEQPSSNKKEGREDKDEDDEKDKDKEKETKEEEYKHEQAILDEEPLASDGVFATLRLIQRRGFDPSESLGGRKNDRLHVQVTDDPAPEIRLERRDEFGRLMTEKEAFRKLSHKFHGKEPGKAKQEKRLKRLEEERKKQNMSSVDTPLMTVKAMQEQQQRTKSPFIILSGKGSVVKDLPSGIFKELKDEELSKPSKVTTAVPKTNLAGAKKVEFGLPTKRKGSTPQTKQQQQEKRARSD
jgi:U4/U6.U5 tri-snRNP-associated protein 1